MKEYVAASHKLSLTLLGIVFVCWQISQNHTSRIRMLNDAKELLTIEVFLRSGDPAFALPPCTDAQAAGRECMAAIRYREQRREVDPLSETLCAGSVTRMRYVVDHFAGAFELALMGDGAQISKIRIPGPSSLCEMWPELLPVNVRLESFGRLSLYKVNMNCREPMKCRSMTAFLATGADPDYGSWSTGLFSPIDPSIKPDINHLSRNLGIDVKLTGAERIEAIQTKLFGQKIKIPFLDEVSVPTELAVWVLAFGSFFVLVNMRNQLRLALAHPEPSHETPWILLDASSFTDRLVAGLWWVLQGLSGVVTSFALILSATDSSQAALTPQPILVSAFSFCANLLLGAANVWASLECTGYLALLRDRRQEYHRSLEKQEPAIEPNL
ncbi:MAG: hypothetical protein U0Q16_01585 [Bryobacteraceae bacterium]